MSDMSPNADEPKKDLPAGIRVFAILSHKIFADGMNKVSAEDQSIVFNTISHDEPQDIPPESHLILIECRILEGLQDINKIGNIRSLYPMTPIIAVSQNDDREFGLLAFQKGASEFISDISDPEWLAAKIKALTHFSDSGKLLEIKNHEVVDTMRNLHQSTSDLREEQTSRAQAEKDKVAAQAEAAHFKQIKDITDALGQGMFFIESNLMIGNIASRRCRELFGSEIVGRPLVEVFDFKEDRGVFTQHCLQQVFDDVIPEKISLGLVPKEVQTMDGRTFKMEYRPSRNDEGQLFRIVAVVDDITQEIASKEEAQFRERRDRCLINILKDRDHFLLFLSETKEFIKSFEGDDRETIFRALHTIKGTSAGFGFYDVAKFAHQSENVLGRSTSDEFFNEAKAIGAEIEKMLRLFLEEYHDVLHISFNSQIGDHHVVDNNVIEAFQIIANDAPEDTKSRLLEALQLLKDHPVSLHLSSFERTTKNLANRHKKKIKFITKGTDTRIDLNIFSELFQSLIHPITNACIHGLEDPAGRKLMNKPPEGTISLSFAKDKIHQLLIEIEDDGAGINANQLVKKAITKGFMTEEQAQKLDDQEKLDLVFQDGLSNATKVTQSAGRGVGLSALRQAVQALSGNISIESKKDLGTKFTIAIPKKMGQSKTKSKGPKILICEDEFDLRVLYRDLLSEISTNIDDFDNGLDGLLALAKKEYDVIITDLKMPSMTGQSLIKKFRSVQKTPTPILIVSAFVTTALEQDMQDIPGLYFLGKGFNITKLTETVADILDKSSKK